jgi:hypothetical protein
MAVIASIAPICRRRSSKACLCLQLFGKRVGIEENRDVDVERRTKLINAKLILQVLFNQKFSGMYENEPLELRRYRNAKLHHPMPDEGTLYGHQPSRILEIRTGIRCEVSAVW